MSSWYLSSTPSVSDTVAGSSATTSSSDKAAGPIERLGDAGRFEQILLAQRLHETHHLLGKFFADARQFGAHDGELALGARIADPVIETAPLERVMHFAGAVRGDDHDGRMCGLHRAHFRDGDLKIAQHFEQERLECLVGAVDLVDQQHRRAGGVGLERLKERPLDQKALGEHVVFEPGAVVLAFGLGDADGDHLCGVIPFIDRSGDVEPLVALQPDQAAAERRGQHLGDLGLADAGLAFEEDRPGHLERQIKHRAERAVGQIVGLGQEVDRGVDRGRERTGGNWVHAAWI